MRVSVIITAFKEPETVKKAVSALTCQLRKTKDQLLVVAPDRETRRAAESASPLVKTIKDRGKGKPAALNLAFKKVNGEIVILTDGDVQVKRGAVKQLISRFSDKKTGIVSGRPVPVNEKNSLFGFWAYLLTETAHQMRLKREKESLFFDCSGYLLAMRKKLLTKIPDNTLAEDSFLSQKVLEKGFKTGYAPKAEVMVKFPDNFSDWIRQKVRSVGGAAVSPMRGWKNELKESIFLLSLPKTLKEWFWLLLLFFARAYLWLLIFWKLKIRRLSFEKVWQRVESTK